MSDVERACARARSSTTPVLIDEGLVQAGVALWICTPPERRAELWREYCDEAVGRDTMVLHCDHEQALSRVQARGQGLPWVFAEAEQLRGAPLDAVETFAEIARLLADLPGAMAVDANADAAVVRDRARAVLQETKA